MFRSRLKRCKPLLASSDGTLKKSFSAPRPISTVKTSEASEANITIKQEDEKSQISTPANSMKNRPTQQREAKPFKSPYQKPNSNANSNEIEKEEENHTQSKFCYSYYIIPIFK